MTETSSQLMLKPLKRDLYARHLSKWIQIQWHRRNWCGIGNLVTKTWWKPGQLSDIFWWDLLAERCSTSIINKLPSQLLHNILFQSIYSDMYFALMMNTTPRTCSKARKITWFPDFVKSLVFLPLVEAVFK